MEAVLAGLRKLEFPASAEAAVKYIHGQCQKFSKSGVPSPQELTSLIDFIDEFLFSGGPGRGAGGKGAAAASKKGTGRRLTAIQQLQLIQTLADYFTGQQDFNLLCSVFMIVFMVQGKEPEYKVATLAKLLSYALALHAVPILNFGGVWLTQQTPSSSHALAVARQLVQDWVCGPTQPQLARLPAASPLFTTNLLAAVGELYSRAGGEAGHYTPPPRPVLHLVTAWLEGDGSTGKSDAPAPPVPGSSPAAPLLSWPVLAPLLAPADQTDDYSRLQLALVDCLLRGEGEAAVPGKYLNQLTSSLLARLKSVQCTEELQQTALDRYGQLIAAALAARRAAPDQELLGLMSQLPPNRLVRLLTRSADRSGESRQ